jgi:hypothetical protein
MIILWLQMMCVLYTALSLIWMLCRAVSVPRLLSPAIKPVEYRDSDALLRRSLAAVNWGLVANKVRALDGLKHKKHALKKTSLNSESFTYGQHSFKIRSRPQST